MLTSSKHLGHKFERIYSLKENQSHGQMAYGGGGRKNPNPQNIQAGG